MKLFTPHDVALSICTHQEVGSPWEARFSIDDHFNGLCPMAKVGSPKPIAPPEPSPEPQASDSPTPFTSLSDATNQAFNRLGMDAFMSWAEKNPAQFFDMAAKHGFSQLAKATPKELPQLDQITDATLEALSMKDLQRILLRDVGITTKEDLQEALNT